MSATCGCWCCIFLCASWHRSHRYSKWKPLSRIIADCRPMCLMIDKSGCALLTVPIVRVDGLVYQVTTMNIVLCCLLYCCSLLYYQYNFRQLTADKDKLSVCIRGLNNSCRKAAVMPCTLQRALTCDLLCFSSPFVYRWIMISVAVFPTTYVPTMPTYKVHTQTYLWDPPNSVAAERIKPCSINFLLSLIIGLQAQTEQCTA